MSVVVVIVLDSAERFTTSHEFFVSRSRFGYTILSVEAFRQLPEEALASLVPLTIPRMALDQRGGNA